MDDSNEFTVTIHLVHGEPIKFKALLTEVDMMKKADDIEYMLKRYALGMEVDGKLLIVPYSNVKFIEASPAPKELPLFMIRNALSVP